jgi:DNA gyrase inhibitor GyrI
MYFGSINFEDRQVDLFSPRDNPCRELASIEERNAWSTAMDDVVVRHDNPSRTPDDPCSCTAPAIVDHNQALSSEQADRSQRFSDGYR